MRTASFSPVLFQKFGKERRDIVKTIQTNNVVVYTRVSSKEQADKNMSLETQRKAIEEYAIRNNLNVVSYFGGTYESAKTDGRKEFSRMLEFIKRNKRTISQLLVYSIDRFSRTGGAAIKLATDLREQYGISVFAVTQPTDTSNPSGVLHQNIQLLFSEYDNQLRKQKIIAGMKNKLEKGIWVLKAPQGYDNVTINGERKIVVNAEGKKIRKAFQWKLEGISNTEIIDKLKTLGIKMYKQQLTNIFANPFYCGLISHGLLEGEVVEGVHEKLLSPDQFLQINEIRQASPKYGKKHQNENVNISLRNFIKCDVCGKPFTGYLVRKKGLYYYKCNTKGCKCNVSAKTMHNMFADYLEPFKVRPEFQDILLYDLLHYFEELTRADVENVKQLKIQLTEVDKKIKTLREKHFITEEVNKEIYDEFSAAYAKESADIIQKIDASSLVLSNLEEGIKKVLKMCENLNEIWGLADFDTKERFQNLVFPSGLVYDRENKEYRTQDVNPIFYEIARRTEALDDNKKGLTPFLWGKSNWVVSTGIEPVSNV